MVPEPPFHNFSPGIIMEYAVREERNPLMEKPGRSVHAGGRLLPSETY